MKQSDCTSMIHQTAPPTTQPPSPLRESYGADRDSTGMQLPIIGIKKKEASEGNAASGICESGIGVQTAIQQCQPADGRLAACTGPLVSHQQRNQERRRGDEGFKEFGFISLKTTDFNSAKCSGGGTGDACLPASRCEHRCFPELPPPLYPPTPLSHHTHLFSFLNITGANQQTSDCTSFLKLSRITTISSWIIIVNNPSH